MTSLFEALKIGNQRSPQHVVKLEWDIKRIYEGVIVYLIQRGYFIFQYFNMSKISDFSSARKIKNLIFLKKI